MHLTRHKARELLRRIPMPSSPKPMAQTETIDHPAVEIKLPLDGREYRFEIPEDTTLFFWGAIAIGTQNRIPLTDSFQGSRLFRTGLEAQSQMTWSLSIAGNSVSLMTDSYYRKSGYKGLAWWTACEPIESPTSVDVQFKTEGERPTIGEDPVKLWTEGGDQIPWGETVESTLKLIPSALPESEFQTRRECLWDRRSVYMPQENPC